MRAFLPIIFLLFSTLQLSAQQKDIVKNEGITSTLHRASIGKLVFTDKAIHPTELKESDILSTYRLTNKSNLFITFFMDNSLTNYLHRLAPGSTLDELYNNGNFQFAFYVDDKLVYRENLHHGAGLPATKDTQTVVNKPLIDNQHMGRWWSQSMWNRFLMRGGDSVLTDGKHLLKIEVATYINNPGLQTGPLFASGQLALEVKRKPKINTDTVQLNIIKPYNGFPVSAEGFDRTKIKELRGNINEAVFKNITSVVVIKNGKLLIEEYFNGAGRDSLHDTRSVGKSFASTMTGIAQADGYLKSEDQTLKEFFNLKTFANYSPKKDAVAIKELLTMSSAFSGDDDDVNSPGNEENMYPTPDWVKFTLDLPLDTVKP
ncbi:MAG: serine hydrolase, partial [Sphingobacteriales bacterium]